jgi:diguanylate cyclase
MQWKLGIALIVFLSVGTIGSACAQESYDTLLQRADTARSSEPKRFMELMDQLRADTGKRTRLQKQQFQYLEAYRIGIYGDEPARGADIAKVLFKEAKDPSLKYRAGGLVASFSAISRDLSTGLTYLQTTMDMRKSVPDKAIRHEGMANGALLYAEIGQHRMALSYVAEVLADKPNERMQCIAGHHQLVSQFELGLLPTDNARIEAVINQCSVLNERIAANIARAVLAKKLAADGLAEKAVELLEAKLPEVEATHYPRLIAGTHALIADLKLKLGDSKSAETHANITVSMGEQIRSSATLVSAYNTLYKIASAREKQSVALELYKRYAESEIAHLNDVKAKELAYEIVLQQAEQKNKELELLQRKLEVSRLEQTLERESAQKARLAMVFLMLVLAGIVFWAIQVKRHQGQLQRLAQTDTLTGLGNRHFFTEKSERSLIDAARAGESAALVMFDLDHFKAINDTYGHGAGDWVLKQVGKTCSAHCRKIDYLGRIGGEEFAVLLRGFDLTAAARMAEDCRSQLAQIDTRECGYSFVVTASFGVSSSAQSGYDLSRLLSHADQMLYRAKNEGRNRVCAYTAETAADNKSPKRSPTLSVVSS